MNHVAFISFATEDGPIAEAICSALEAESIRCWLAPRDIMPADRFKESIVDAIAASRLIVLVHSSHANASLYVEAEVQLAFDNRVPILAFRLEDVQVGKGLGLMISASHWLEAWKGPWENSLPRLVGAAQQVLVKKPEPSQRVESPAKPTIPPKKLVLSYRRNVEPDESLVRRLEAVLASLGHEVFVDRQMRIGFEWVREIEARVRAADAVIPVLSAESVSSEMLAWEVQTAHDESQKCGGRPRLLPVRVSFEDRLPADLANILDRLHYFLWSGPRDDDRLIEEILEALRGPQTINPPRPVPIGGLPLNSESYVKRATDTSFMLAIDRRDSVILVRGARQMGKTSLLARGAQHARETGATLAFTDYQKFNRSQLATPEAFYKALGADIALELDLDASPEEDWDPKRTPNMNFERYVRKVVLANIDGPLVWAMDEVDRLFSCDFGSEVFGLFRVWHNARAMNPTAPWFRLTMAIAYATEASQFITDLNQSPFNVGTLIALDDLTSDQVADLNVRYDSPLVSESQRAEFMRLVGGQPYLVNRALFEMAERGLTFKAFADQAGRDEGLFGDHLRRILVILASDPGLSDVMQAVILGKTPPDPKSFYNLRAAGILAGDFPRDARPRCQLYADYLRGHLG